MNTFRFSSITVLLLLSFFLFAQSNNDSMDNTLTKSEKKEGWKLLFDGKTLNGWRIYKNKPADSWAVENGTIHCLRQEGEQHKQRGDLMTVDQYENFDFTVDWKLAPQGNSGIIYLASEEYNQSYLTGPEYHIIDDENYGEKLENWQKTGANYAMNPPATLASKPVGEWNRTRIVVNKGHVEHWLNGVKVVDYQLWTDEWKKNKETGKWKDAKDYGKNKKGYICLQDHAGSEVWFKNIKIKPLK
ncbi:MAG: DUF1080 domain-containing protein [Flavisolibacter sp.]|nr:DUF1080 domain-containing protein [Flavisolibacter sp.]